MNHPAMIVAPCRLRISGQVDDPLEQEVGRSRREGRLGQGRSEGQQLDGPIQEQTTGSTMATSGDL